MKYAGNITIYNDLSDVVYERDLTAEEMIEILLGRQQTAPVPEAEDLPPPRRKNDGSKYHGKTPASEARRKSWNSGGDKKMGNMTGKVKELFDAGKDDGEISAALGIGKQAVSYHKRKLGLIKKRAPELLPESSRTVDGPKETEMVPELTQEREEELVVDIRREWIVNNLPVPKVLMRLEISMGTLRYIVQKYGLKKE